MKTLILCLLALTVALAPAHPGKNPVKSLQNWPIYEEGQKVFVGFRYEGDIEGWDGSLHFSGDDGLLTIGNSAYITIFDPKGRELKPKEGKSMHMCRNSYAREPFDVRVNLAAVYDLSMPGVYVVKWGSRHTPDAEQTFEFEIREKPGKDKGDK